MLSRVKLFAQQLSTAPQAQRLARMSSSFTLPNSKPEVKVNLTSDLSKDQLLSFTAFKNWISTLQQSLSLQQQKSHTFNDAPYILRQIDVQAVDFFGGDKLGFVKLRSRMIRVKSFLDQYSCGVEVWA
jgi:hypothetical protein